MIAVLLGFFAIPPSHYALEKYCKDVPDEVVER